MRSGGSVLPGIEEPMNITVAHRIAGSRYFRKILLLDKVLLFSVVFLEAGLTAKDFASCNCHNLLCVRAARSSCKEKYNGERFHKNPHLGLL